MEGTMHVENTTIVSISGTVYVRIPAGVLRDAIVKGGWNKASIHKVTGEPDNLFVVECRKEEE